MVTDMERCFIAFAPLFYETGHLSTRCHLKLLLSFFIIIIFWTELPTPTTTTTIIIIIIYFVLWANIVISVYLIKSGLVEMYFIEHMLDPIVDSDYNMLI